MILPKCKSVPCENRVLSPGYCPECVAFVGDAVEKTKALAADAMGTDREAGAE